MAHSDIKRDDMGLAYLGLLALAAGALYLFWSTYRVDLAYYALKWNWLQLGVFDWFDHSSVIGRWRQQTATMAARPAAVSPEVLIAMLNRTGYCFVWIPILLAARGALRAHRHPANRTRRPITAATLPHIMANHSPAVTPVLSYGDLLNSDPAEHRSSVNPEEWVARHELLINGTMDRDKCRRLLIADLGTAIASLDDLAPYERALFAVFGARLFADGRDHHVAQQLLDKLNRSCRHGTWNGKPGYPELSLCAEAFHRYSAHKDAAAWLAIHSYPRTLLHAMHMAALEFGRLPSSHFRWLKGMDRPLWYALNTTGRKAPFMESAAVFTQTQWEDFAFDNGYRLTEPRIDGAIDGVEAYLVKIGLMAPATQPGEFR